MSKIEACPASRSAACFCPHASACSRQASIPIREAPVESSAPHLTSASSERLFTTCGSARSVKSQIDSNSPPSSRARMIARAADSPTDLTAFRPKRIFPSTTAKSVCEVLTSGGSTSIPSSSHAFTYSGTRSFVLITEEISAAMYSHGWFAFSHAVR